MILLGKSLSLDKNLEKYLYQKLPKIDKKEIAKWNPAYLIETDINF